LCFALAGLQPPRRIGCPYSSRPGSFRAEVFEVRIGAATEKLNGASVTSAFFREVKVMPMAGRLFRDEEYQIAGARVVVIAASLWQRRFGGTQP
jgi:hypothetical protein